MPAAIAGASAEQAKAAAVQGKAGLADAATQGLAQIGGVDSKVGGALAQHAATASAAMAQGATAASTQINQAGSTAAAHLGQAGTQVADQLYQGAAIAGQQVTQAGTEATTQLDQQGTDFQGKARQGAGEARAVMSATVAQAGADQQTNVGTFEGKKASANSQISSEYASQKASADAQSASENQASLQSSGQSFLDLILPAPWTAAIRRSATPTSTAPPPTASACPPPTCAAPICPRPTSAWSPRVASMHQEERRIRDAPAVPDARSADVDVPGGARVARDGDRVVVRGAGHARPLVAFAVRAAAGEAIRLAIAELERAAGDRACAAAGHAVRPVILEDHVSGLGNRTGAIAREPGAGDAQALGRSRLLRGARDKRDRFVLIGYGETIVGRMAHRLE